MVARPSGMNHGNRAGIGMTSARTRERLVQRLRDQGITNAAVLDQIRNVPRHLFVDEALATRAYEDTALPIGHGQTISQPYVVARMTEALLENASPGKVLESRNGLRLSDGGAFAARKIHLQRRAHQRVARSRTAAIQRARHSQRARASRRWLSGLARAWSLRCDLDGGGAACVAESPVRSACPGRPVDRPRRSGRQATARARDEARGRVAHRDARARQLRAAPPRPGVSFIRARQARLAFTHILADVLLLRNEPSAIQVLYRLQVTDSISKCNAEPSS